MSSSFPPLEAGIQEGKYTQDICFECYKYLPIKKDDNIQMEASPRLKGTNDVFELSASDEKALQTINSEAEDAF